MLDVVRGRASLAADYDTMEHIDFRGIVHCGVGRHNEMVVPGRSVISSAPLDWPEKLYPGSLNVLISPDGYPVAFSARGIRHDVRKLDEIRFAPAFEIPRDKLLNNLLSPRPGVPRGGDAQVWRVVLILGDLTLDPPCWVLRRFGSRVGQQLELVAEGRLRDLPGIRDDVVVIVRMYGRWTDTVAATH